MSAPYFQTGSDEKPAVCFVEGNKARQDYGVPLYYSQGCPYCHGPVRQLLAFNPTDSYYYLAPCPLCGKFIRYCDINENPDFDFTLVRSSKSTPLDNDVDFPNHWV